jgi:hypothetical protein
MKKDGSGRYRPPQFTTPYRSADGDPVSCRQQSEKGWNVVPPSPGQLYTVITLPAQTSIMAGERKVLTYTEYHSVCPLVGIGTPSTPLPLARVTPPPPPPKGGGGAHSPAAKGVGESQFRRLEKKLSTLLTLCRRASV